MAAEVLCAACGSANEAGRKFCGECGSSLTTACPSCGTPNAPWREVLRRVRDGAHRQRSSAARRPARQRPRPSVASSPSCSPTSSASPPRLEGRDAEEMRELLSRYFDTARGIDRALRRHRGEVHRRRRHGRLGHADGDRGRRRACSPCRARPCRGGSALELDRAPELQARAGVLTGEAAVTLGAEGQGMVAGDLVNTAARIQAAAEPGHRPRR